MEPIGRIGAQQTLLPDGRVVNVGDAREQVVLNLKVEATGKVKPERRVGAPVAGCADLLLGPVLVHRLQ